MRNLIKLFAFTLVLGAIIFPISAFASSNSGARVAGEGEVAISGWTLSNLQYQHSGNPAFINSVTFDLDAPADQVAVKLNSMSNEFSTCLNAGGYHWQCNFQAEVKVSSMDEFRVIAVGN